MMSNQRDLQNYYNEKIEDLITEVADINQQIKKRAVKLDELLLERENLKENSNKKINLELSMHKVIIIKQIID